ncbi:hypothetical protein D3C86_1285400 [compost metagenome]
MSTFTSNRTKPFSDSASPGTRSGRSAFMTIVRGARPMPIIVGVSTGALTVQASRKPRPLGRRRDHFPLRSMYSAMAITLPSPSST